MQADWNLFLAGIGIGLMMSAPIGPVNFLCFHRTLHRGIIAGLSIGAGALIADALFASVAVFGLAAARTFIDDNFALLQFLGGLVLIGFGIYLLLHKPAEMQPTQKKQKLWHSVVSGFALSITNPGNFFGFLAMFSGLSEFLAQDDAPLKGVPLIVGVVTGAAVWWCGLSVFTHYLRGRTTQQALLRINKIAGAIIFCLGVILILRYTLEKLNFIAA